MVITDAIMTSRLADYSKVHKSALRYISEVLGLVISRLGDVVSAGWVSVFHALHHIKYIPRNQTDTVCRRIHYDEVPLYRQIKARIRFGA